MQCPVCLVELRMTDRQGVEIDYCPQCRGVWLDRGELDKIIERNAMWRSPDPLPGYREGHRDHDDHDEYRHRKRRRSFLDDLFDFD